MEKEDFLRLLPRLIREDDEVKGAIISALSAVMATKNDIERIIQHSDKRFEAIQKQMADRFEAMDKRFEAMDKRFEAMDKRFEAIQKQMADRFEAMDKRFEQINERISITQETLISHSKTLKIIAESTQDIRSLKDLNLKMIQLEKSSATQYKTLDGKIDIKFDQLNEKIENIEEKMSTKEDINELKKILLRQK